MSEVIVAASRCITANDFLAVYYRRDRDVLTNGEAKDIVWMGKREAVTKAW
jgi:hypothetical protein